MDESFYHKEADKELAKLLEYAEMLEEDFDAEVELDSGVLTLTLPNKRQYVINKHTPSRQIWVSSPVSGAGYFEYMDGKWLPKRIQTSTEADLETFLKSELKELLAN